MSNLHSHQNRKTHHTHHQTPYYGTYANLGQQATGRGTIHNIQHRTTNYQNGPPSPLEELEKHCSPSAAFDSASRFDPPRCTETTRRRITRIIEKWINSEGDSAVPSSLFWLHGGAGVGKSALAQSLSEKFQAKKQLAASFFFFRNDPTRSNGELLIPTLVSQLVRTFKNLGIVPIIAARIHDNPALFTKRFETQIQELLVEPLLALKSTGALITRPRLIVIDGLDECKSTDMQCAFLRVIARAIPQIPYPLRFLIASRPEAHIRAVFNHNCDLQAVTVHEYNLSNDPDADMDIRMFLEKEFVEIRRVHRLGRHLPHTWPGQKAINSLVERSSGHFIYASTVIKYIRSPKHRSDNRLEVILRLRTPQVGDKPYAQLDALYTLIFDGTQNLEQICLILGVLYFRDRKGSRFFSDVGADFNTIEGLFAMETGDLVLLLDPIISLVALDGDTVRILHKSLFDFLLDVNRRGDLPFDLAQVHELAATHILKHKLLKGVCGVENFEDFAFHCQYALLNDALKDYLHSLEVPYPKSVATQLKVWRLSVNDLNLLQSTMWFFFRTLSRQDFDSTGRVAKQYATKWTDYFRSPGPRRKEPIRAEPIRSEPVRAAVVMTSNKTTLFQKIGHWLKLNRPLPLDKPLTESKPQTFVRFLKEADSDCLALRHQLDTLLVGWKPSNLNSVDVGMRRSAGRVASIKRMHGITSASVIAAFSGNPNAIVSSLVLGDCFIHSYHFRIRDEVSRSVLILQSYSMHRNTSYGRMYTMGSLGDAAGILMQTQSYLKTVGDYLFSELYQKYGLNPDQDTFVPYLDFQWTPWQILKHGVTGN